MRTLHFEQLRPVCPVCRTAEQEHALSLARVIEGDDDQVLEGLLCCTNQRCQHEYPILDGVPILLSQLRQYVSDNLLAIVGRDDLSPTMADVLGDCCGPATAYDTIRQHLSSYAWGHYARWDEDEPAWNDTASVYELLEQCQSRLGAATGPVLDAGCSVGGVSLALGASTDQLVLGIDTNFSMLRLAQRVLRSGVVEYPRRRCGLVYDHRRIELPNAPSENVDYWACDLMALPLRGGSFAQAIALNTLDSVPSPLGMLQSLREVLATGGRVALACPYDWTGVVTPVEQWLGGHSARGPQRGASDRTLEDLLTPGAHPGAVEGLRLVDRADNLPWRVRWHERGTIDYRVHMVVAEKT